MMQVLRLIGWRELGRSALEAVVLGSLLASVLYAAMVLGLLAMLAGCAPSAPRAPAGEGTGGEAIAAQPPPNPLPAIIDALPLPPPKPPAPALQPLIPERAVDLIVGFEIGSPEAYARKYNRPLWPGAASGVTVGIGYDLGYQTAEVIVLDWHREPHHARLATVAGITGPVARQHARTLADIAIAYGLAREVFDQTSLVEHWRIARRVFRREHFDAAAPMAQGALTSLVFNRGGAMAGERRREMRAIRDDCLPRQDYRCAAQQLRAMVRIWENSSIEAGMRRRREAEAALMESAAT